MCVTLSLVQQSLDGICAITTSPFSWLARWSRTTLLRGRGSKHITPEYCLYHNMCTRVHYPCPSDLVDLPRIPTLCVSTCCCRPWWWRWCCALARGCWRIFCLIRSGRCRRWVVTLNLLTILRCNQCRSVSPYHPFRRLYEIRLWLWGSLYHCAIAILVLDPYIIPWLQWCEIFCSVTASLAFALWRSLSVTPGRRALEVTSSRVCRRCALH